MKKNLIIVFLFFSISPYTFASFPVKSNNPQSKIITSNNDDELITFPEEFHFGGFILGLLLGIIGVGLAYILSNNTTFRRSAWYGLGAWIIVYLLLIGALAGFA